MSSSAATGTGTGGAKEGTPSPTVIKGGSKSGVDKGVHGCGIRVGAVLAVFCVFGGL